MEITKTFTPRSRAHWRQWLKRNHIKAKEIWLVYFNKTSGKWRLPYNDAVDEAVCFGWIDSTIKKMDHERFCQRFSPRRPKSPLSPMNKERIRRLKKQGLMAPAGLATLKIPHWKFTLPPQVKEALMASPPAWENFQKFPLSYRRIRVGWIVAVGSGRADIVAQRLRYFVKMTAQNKRFGMVQ
jgi:uncharacterized protein YdeI (YjbR/CyaY-like superfamily)